MTLGKNGTALALDAAGVGVSLLPGGKLAVAGVGLALGAASMLNSGAQGDLAGIGIGVVGYHLTAAGPAAEVGALGKLVAGSLPVLGTAVSVGALLYDSYGAYSDYEACMAGAAG